MWAIVNSKGEAIPVSHTERGAKCYASRNGYRRVAYISHINNMVVRTMAKEGAKWREE